MTLEEKVTAALRTVVPRVFRGTAPVGTEQPYITYQRIGGQPDEYLDGSVSPKRNAWVQVNVWGGDPDALIQQIELTLRASKEMQVTPQSEARDTDEPDMELVGAGQDFDIWADR
jgi:hypothetical protein